MKGKRTTKKPQGSFGLIWDGISFSWFQLTKNRVIIYSLSIFPQCVPLTFSYLSVGGRLQLLALATTVHCLPSPIRQKERTDVRDGRRSRPKLRQCHDVFEGDVCLCANIYHTHILWCTAVVMCNSSIGSGGGPPEDLDNDGVSSDGLHHCLLMVDLGEVTRIHLWEGATKSLGHPLSSCCM